MNKLPMTAAISLALALAAAQASASDIRKEVRLEIAPGGTISIVNNFGSVTLKSDNGRQVVLAYTTHSDKVEVDRESTADKRRIEVRTHVLNDQKLAPEEARVEYEITVPAGLSVTVNTATAPITADTMTGDISLSSDTGQVNVRNVYKSHLRVRSVAGAVNLNHLNGVYAEITSSGGAVQLVDVTGPRVSVGTGSGNITYQGDCAGVGEYSFSTHSGSIDMMLPETASVDLNAHSVTGEVHNDFPLTKKSHLSYVPKEGRSFSGTSNSGSSSVQLQSMSGKIRVKKQ